MLTWLTVVPPDRVGVARKLQLGVTLKPTVDGLRVTKPTAMFAVCPQQPPRARRGVRAAAGVWVTAAGLTAASRSSSWGALRVLY